MKNDSVLKFEIMRWNCCSCMLIC